MIQKTLATNFGIDATVWKIGLITPDFISNTLNVHLNGYADETAIGNHQPIREYDIVIPAGNYLTEEEVEQACIHACEEFQTIAE